jgi:hypothetical protein
LSDGTCSLEGFPASHAAQEEEDRAAFRAAGPGIIVRENAAALSCRGRVLSLEGVVVDVVPDRS